MNDVDDNNIRWWWMVMNDNDVHWWRLLKLTKKKSYIVRSLTWFFFRVLASFFVFCFYLPISWKRHYSHIHKIQISAVRLNLANDDNQKWNLQFSIPVIPVIAVTATITVVAVIAVIAVPEFRWRRVREITSWNSWEMYGRVFSWDAESTSIADRLPLALQSTDQTNVEIKKKSILDTSYVYPVFPIFYPVFPILPMACQAWWSWSGVGPQLSSGSSTQTFFFRRGFLGLPRAGILPNRSPHPHMAEQNNNSSSYLADSRTVIAAGSNLTPWGKRGQSTQHFIFCYRLTVVAAGSNVTLW